MNTEQIISFNKYLKPQPGIALYRRRAEKIVHVLKTNTGSHRKISIPVDRWRGRECITKRIVLGIPKTGIANRKVSVRNWNFRLSATLITKNPPGRAILCASSMTTFRNE